MTPPAMPVPARPSGRRLTGVDAARGLALLGMMAVHVIPAVDAAGHLTGAHLVASGRSSALFAVLAGVGLALASGGPSPPRGRALGAHALGIAARSGVIFLIGLFIGAFDSGVAVILAYYGLLFLVAIPFLRLGAPALLALAAVWAVVVPALSYVLRIDAPAPLYANPTLASLAAPGDLLRELLLTGYYPVLPWTAYLLMGLGIGRLRLARPRVGVVMLAAGTGAAAISWVSSWLLVRDVAFEHLVAAGLGGHPASRSFTDGVLGTSFYGTTPTTSWWWLTVASPHTATTFDLVHTGGAAAAVIGLMLLVALRAGPLLTPLSSIGSMTLTLYSLHVVLLATVLPGTTEHAWFWHAAIAFAVAIPWRALRPRGPLEALAASSSRQAQALIGPKPGTVTTRPDP